MTGDMACKTVAQKLCAGRERTRFEQIGTTFAPCERVRRCAWATVLTLLVALVMGIGGAGCQGKSSVRDVEGRSQDLAPGVYAVDLKQDCLPRLTLTDADGKPVDLASLKGKLVLIDFIYTSCPGPCELMTTKIARAATRLGDELGRSVEIVSVTLDPERDTPGKLLEFAKQQGAVRPGWLFLTGTPQAVESLMERFKLKRRREADGSIDHVTILYLLAADGHPIRIYDPSQVTPEALAADIKSLARQS